jgi:radical SAM superfamily enzyme YgiQ (UPF0313 family)
MARALLLVPWIYDFAAYDFWSCPLGLLQLGALLRTGGWQVDYLDLTDRHHPALPWRPPEQRFNTGKYYAEEIAKPPALAWVPRRYKRYGLPPAAAEATVRALERPDVVLVTSRMTYWYPGVRDAISLCRRVWGRVPVVLGGTYATLCPAHARERCGADVVWQGEGEAALARLVEEMTGVAVRRTGGVSADPAQLDTLPFPAWDLRPWNKALTLETSRGCPYHCTYCATAQWLPHWRAKSPARVADEIEYCVRELGAEDIAFADDALLLASRRHFLTWADEVQRRRIRVRFHTPNSLFASMITQPVAETMRSVGVETVRVSLESASDERLRSLDRRVRPHHFVTAMRHLHAAGYAPGQLGVYILCGLPGQSLDEVRQAIDLVIDEGATPRLAEYSPIPGTREWEKAVRATELPIAEEPLLQNNSIFAWASGAVSPEALSDLRRYAIERAAANGTYASSRGSAPPGAEAAPHQ